MLDIAAYLPAKKKKTASGWISFNAPCCHNRGHKSDRRNRGGIKISEQGWSYHCFNCQFTASFILGRSMGQRARHMLAWLGVPELEIERANLDSIRHRSFENIIDDRQRTVYALIGTAFEERDLPQGFVLIDKNTPVHWSYLRDRCIPEDYPCGMTTTPSDAKYSARSGVIIPFTHDHKIVGHTIRYLDDRRPKYVSESQPGYVFGIDLQHKNWQYVLVMEGIFDALSIGGLALMHNAVSDAQARLIRSLERKVIVVPDRDLSGLDLVDRALELGWAVSMPDWDESIKDVNDAVVKYGRLATLLIIMQAKETSRIKIELRKKQLVKRLQR